MEQKTCPFKSECQLQQVGNLAHTEIIRELVCDSEPRGCKTFLRMQKEREKDSESDTPEHYFFDTGAELSATVTVR